MNLEEKKNKLARLEEANQASYQALRQRVPSMQMDATSARLECLIESLKETGTFTEEQAVDFELKFHSKVQEGLDSSWQQINNQKSAVVKPIKKGLIIPRG